MSWRNALCFLCSCGGFGPLLRVSRGSNVPPFTLQANSTALMYAIGRGHAACVRLLIKAGANMEAESIVRVGVGRCFVLLLFALQGNVFYISPRTRIIVIPRYCPFARN